MSSLWELSDIAIKYNDNNKTKSNGRGNVPIKMQFKKLQRRNGSEGGKSEARSFAIEYLMSAAKFGETPN